jgi:ribose transport system substrate-binding protein
MLRLLVAIALVFGLGLLAPGQESKPLRIGLVTTDASDYWKVVEYAASKAAMDGKAELIVKKPADGEIAQQTKLYEELATEKLAGLITCPLDPKTQSPLLAKGAKMAPLVLFDSEYPDTGRTLAVLSDHKQGGKLAGQLIKEAMPKGGVIAVFTGTSQSWGSKERLKGMCGELGIDMEKSDKSKDGKYRLLTREPFTDNVNPMQAKAFALEALGRVKNEPNVCMVGLWVYHAPAILGAVQEQGMTGKVTIIGFEEHGATLRGIDDGHIYATIVQNPMAMVTRAVEVVLARARKQPVKLPPGSLEWVPHRIVTKTGGDGRLKAADYAAELGKILSP